MTSSPPTRLYARVSESLTSRIESGHYVIGDKLPSERLLSQEYQVSRPTIREALFALELTGLVEVRVGSGVYVKESARPAPAVRGYDMGPFEMLEARLAIEGEACALAAVRTTPEQLVELELLIDEIAACGTDVVRAEMADRRFHETIAAATQNQAMAKAVEQLWEARAHSRECQLMSAKARAAGVRPSVIEHQHILDGIRSGDPAAARTAMHKHLTRVLDSIMQATEVEEVEQVKARVAAQRRKFGVLA